MRDRERPRCLMVSELGPTTHIVDWAQACAPIADVLIMGFGTREFGDRKRAARPLTSGEVKGIPYAFAEVSTLRPSRLFWRLNAQRRARALIRAVRSLTIEFGAPDIIHGHWYSMAPTLLAASRSLGCPYVHTEHSSRMTSNSNPPSRTGEKSIAQLIDQATGIMAVGDEVAKALTMRGAKNVSVMHNPVDPSAFDLSQAPEGIDRIRLITIGRLVRSKRHAELLRAFSEFLGRSEIAASLTIVGSGPMLGELVDEVNRLELNEVVELTGWLDRPLVADRLASSHLYVHASEVETFSISLVEAQMSGLPVVAVRSGGVAESVQDWQGSSIRSASIEELCSGILHVASRIHEYDRSGIAEFARDKYGLGAASEILRDFYMDALGE